jgi:hypothetical protein
LQAVADQKTRIIPRKQAPGETGGTEPRRIGDKIVFFCPNGDKIVVPAKLAGKRGECSKCKVAVVIPRVEAAGEEEPQVSPVEVADQTGALSEPEKVQPAEEVPVAEEPAEGQAEEPAAAPASGPAEEGWKFMVEPAEGVESSHVGLDLNAAGPAERAAWGSPPISGGGEGHDHPAARLVARLWAERGHGGIIELHLAGGSVILPEWYEMNWSRGTHGLFASQAVDGTVTLTAVAWDTIEKIVVRQVQGLPDGMFE